MNFFRLLFGISLLLPNYVFAQNLHFYGLNGKVLLSIDRTELCLHFQEELSQNVCQAVSHAQLAGFEEEKRLYTDHFIYQFESPQAEQAAQVAEQLFGQNEKVRSAYWGLRSESGARMWLSHRVLYQPGPAFRSEALAKILLEYAVITQNQSPTGIHFIELEQIESVLNLANELAESGLMDWAQPDFLMPVRAHSQVIPNDSLFGVQYYLHNTGQTVNAQNTEDVDIDAPEAWCINTGNTGIIVAVVDEGVEAHEDLEDGSGSSRVLAGYTASDPLNGDGSPLVATDAHGQAVAGIIAASQGNSIGASGVAPNVQLLPVHVFTDGSSSNSEMADAINWAWQNGADVINNSWGFDFCAADGFIPVIEQAINDARSSGRAGLGCLVSFSAGEKTAGSPGDCVAYPGSLPTVLTVGGLTGKGFKPNYVKFGSQLDVVSPTSPTPNNPNIRILDRMGELGYNFSGTTTMDIPNINYSRYFGGTSVSCGTTSGVAALVLSQDPTLTESQLKSLIINTATDIGPSGFDTLFGHGIVNAYDALIGAGGTCNSGLDADLADFFGQVSGTGIELFWTTHSEFGMAEFVVEKEKDGIHIILDRVPAVGTSYESQSYQFRDLKPSYGKNLYRLQLRDTDGQVELSNWVEVFYDGETIFSLSPPYPNPSMGQCQFFVEFDAGQKVHYRLLDLHGRTWLSGESHSKGIQLNTSLLSAGLYEFVVQNQEGKQLSRRLLVH